MQYEFMPGRGTADVVFVVSRLSEEFIFKNMKLFFMFIDLEKAFNWVPGEMICLALRQKGASEYLVNGVMSPCKGCKTTVSVDGGTI